MGCPLGLTVQKGRPIRIGPAFRPGECLKQFGPAGVLPVNALGTEETETMTIGDILAVIAAVLLVGASWAATILMIALAFPARVVAAQAKLTAAPGVCLGRGLAARDRARPGACGPGASSSGPDPGRSGSSRRLRQCVYRPSSQRAD